MKAIATRGWWSRKRVRVAIGLLTIAVLAVLAVLVWSLRIAPARAAAEVSLKLPFVFVGSPRGQVAAVKAGGPGDPSHTVAAGDEGQLCSDGLDQAGQAGRISREDAAALLVAAVEATRRSTLAAMAASADVRAQAAAHFFQYNEPAQREALARLAAGSSDPQVYAWAHYACHRADGRPKGACQLIHTEQWARLDAGNAMPWLSLASEAATRGDAAALDDAMFHIASATRMDSGLTRLPSAVVASLPLDADLYGGFAMVMEAFGIEAAVPLDYGTTLRFCKAEKLVDSNRRQVCERVADLFVDRSATLIDRSIGIALAKSVGWPAPRLQQARDEIEASQGLAEFGMFKPDASYSCAGLRHQLNYVLDIGTAGEVDILRKAMLASGKPIAQLAADYRKASVELMEKLQRQEAASSASAAAVAPAGAER